MVNCYFSPDATESDRGLHCLNKIYSNFYSTGQGQRREGRQKKRWEDNINSLTPVTKIPEFANNVGLDEVAHNELPHLDLHCLPSSL